MALISSFGTTGNKSFPWVHFFPQLNSAGSLNHAVCHTCKILHVLPVPLNTRSVDNLLIVPELIQQHRAEWVLLDNAVCLHDIQSAVRFQGNDITLETPTDLSTAA